MNRKNAARIIHWKIKDWLKSLPPFLAAQVQPKIIVTGGSISSLLTGVKVNDFDVYFTDADAAYAVATYYVEMFKAKKQQGGIDIPITVEKMEDRVKIKVKSAGLAVAEGEDYRYFEQDMDGAAAESYAAAAVMAAELAKKEGGYRPIWISNNAITLSNDIQIVTRFFGTPSQIHKNFDYVHCTGSWWSISPDELVLPEAMLHSLLSKQLFYNGSKYPICSVARLRKFLKAGWIIDGGQILKMCWQISQLNLNDMAVLEDQLTGVDSAYFMELLTILKKDVEQGKTIDQTYIASLIDKIF